MVKEGDKNILCDISNILNIKRTARFAFWRRFFDESKPVKEIGINIILFEIKNSVFNLIKLYENTSLKLKKILFHNYMERQIL